MPYKVISFSQARLLSYINARNAFISIYPHTEVIFLPLVLLLSLDGEPLRKRGIDIPQSLLRNNDQKDHIINIYHRELFVCTPNQLANALFCCALCVYVKLFIISANNCPRLELTHACADRCRPHNSACETMSFKVTKLKSNCFNDQYTYYFTPIKIISFF